LEFQISVDIEAPPGVVWAVMSDIERWADWTPSVRSIRKRGSGPLAVGSRASIRQPRLPPALWTVTAIDRGRSFSWITGNPLVRVIAHHAVEPAGAGSRATLSIRFEGLLGAAVGHWTRDLNTRYLALEAAGLKKQSESARRAG
jgi:hypothetical protein